jgi:hypothetical protein
MFNDLFLKIMPFMGYVEKCCNAEEITDENTLSRMHFACGVTQATNTYLEYVILIAFPRQQRLCECASILLIYVHCLFFICAFKDALSLQAKRLASNF